MRNSPQQIPKTDRQIQKATQLALTTLQYGKHQQEQQLTLLDLPGESLTHITSYLEPPSLLSLARVNKLLYEHLNDDNTWHQAFIRQCLGIDLENDHHYSRELLLKKSEPTWKQEFVMRYNLRRRWMLSRNTTITHVPHTGAISSIQLMPSYGLLTSSIQYGIVSRSLPLTGKVLRGFLDASGTGLGIGNPNAEFTPNVSACALSSDGGTAKILWGFRSGELAIMTANKAMDGGGRAAARLIRCNVEDEHGGPVTNVIWAQDTPDKTLSIAASAANDGRVKIWDAKAVRCLWTSDPRDDTLVRDSCLKIALSMAQGVLVAVMQSGQIFIWTGLGCLLGTTGEFDIRLTVVPSLIPEAPANESEDHHDIANLFVASNTNLEQATVLVHYYNTHTFHRITARGTSVEVTPFGGDPALGVISAIYPSFADQPSGYVLAGDTVGHVSLYNWNAPPNVQVYPIVRFEANDEGVKITSIASNGVVLAVGSAVGSIHIFDALTFEPLRSFVSHVPRQRGRTVPVEGGEAVSAVSTILLSANKQLLIAALGSRVLAWQAGPVGKGHDVRAKGKAKSIGSGKRREKSGSLTTKYLQRTEIQDTIQESQLDHRREHSSLQQAYGRQREQHHQLQSLGLNEVEAVEYILMLSRDEDERRQVELVEQDVGEDIFEDDLESPPGTVVSSTPSSRRSSTTSAYSSPSGRSIVGSGSGAGSRSITSPRVSPSKSNVKVQISPRLTAEPMEAGASISPSSLGETQLLRTPVIRSEDHSEFPVFSGSRDSSRANTPSPPVTRSTSESSIASAWSTPLRGTISGIASGTWSAVAQKSAPSLISPGRGSGATSTRLDDPDDADLKFALELSLAEARSRGGV